MAASSSIYQLPTELRKSLDTELVNQHFHNYKHLVEWINNQINEAGFEMKISKSALQRYGVKIQENIKNLQRATETAKIIATEVGDDDGTMNDALLRMFQTKIFDLMQDLEIKPEEIDPNKLGKLISDLSKASVSQKKFMREVRSEIAAAEKTVTGIVKKAGLSKKAVADIKAEILGIASNV